MDFWALYLWAAVCMFWKIYDDLQETVEVNPRTGEEESFDPPGWGTYVGIGVICLLFWWLYPVPAIARWLWSRLKPE